MGGSRRRPFAMVVILVIAGIFALIVIGSIIGARRGTPMAFGGGGDVEMERARATARHLGEAGSVGGEPPSL